MKKVIDLKKAAVMLLIGITLHAKAQTVDPADDPHIEHLVKSFLNKLNSAKGTPIEQLSPKAARAVLSNAQSAVKVDMSGIVLSEKTIVQKGQSFKITIVKPLRTTGKIPVFMFFHGGGWVLGDFATHKRLVRDLVVGSGAAAVFVNYTPSPEAHYPVAINQAYAATEWVAQHGAEIGVDGNRLAVVGNSVGGNMAAVVALKSKNENGPKLRLQVLLWPVTDASFETNSYKEYATGRFLTQNMMRWFWDNYTKNEQERNEIYASPLRATIAQLRGLPPALIQTAENDVLRDEGEHYARKLDEAGVRVVSTRYNGMIHDWGLLNTLAEVPATKAAISEACAQLKNALK